MAHFFENFNPFRGDVVYGTTGDRTEYIQAFLTSPELRYLEQRERQQFSLRYPGFFINDWNKPIGDADFKRPSNLRLRANAADMQRYIDHLQQHAKFAPAKTEQAKFTTIAKGDLSIKTVGHAPLTDQERADLLQSLAIRRACKFGIEYTTEARSGIIHYILDEIDMKEVVNKKQRRIYDGHQGVPVTTSELRYLFREWFRYREKKNVKFYRRRFETAPPWEDDPKLWLSYAQERVTKYRDNLRSEGQLRGFDKAVAEGRFLDAINWFHDMRVGLIAA